MKKIDLTSKRKKLEALLEEFRPEPCYYSTKKGQIRLVSDEVKRGERLIDDAQKELDKLDEEISQPYSDFSNKDKGKAFEFLKLLGLHFCPYCNINDVYAIFDENGEKICRPDIDHFLLMSKYPEKQLDLENLVPSCLMCNQRLKGTTPFSNTKYLNPYKEDFDSIMEIKLDLIGANYLSEDNFKIIFEKKQRVGQKKTKSWAKKVERAENNIDVFKLEERYQYYKDEIIPIMRKIDFYKHKKRQEIEKLFDQNYCIPFRKMLFPEENCDINNTRLGKLKKDVIKAFLK